jgi:2-dehydro-3-deoxyphosphogluconate aldolase/(4S)-4-hydroxy-2-oxoglutarate aldolase
MARPGDENVLAQMEAGGVIPIFTADDPITARQVAACVVEGGLRVLEFTNRSAAALAVFGDLVRWGREELPSLKVGIGTITDSEAAQRALDLGACFVVGPCLVEEVAAVCSGRRVPYIPGCATVTEMWRAHQLGAAMVKLFPAAALGGPEFLRAVRAACPWVRAVPTGGVEPSEESLRAWFGAGAPAVGLGSNLLPPRAIAAGDWPGLRRSVAAVVAAAAAARAGDPFC